MHSSPALKGMGIPAKIIERQSQPTGSLPERPIFKKERLGRKRDSRNGANSKKATDATRVSTNRKEKLIRALTEEDFF